jgi:hypothetical protein
VLWNPELEGYSVSKRLWEAGFQVIPAAVLSLSSSYLIGMGDWLGDWLFVLMLLRGGGGGCGVQAGGVGRDERT